PIPYPGRSQVPASLQGSTHEIRPDPQGGALWVTGQEYEGAILTSPPGDLSRVRLTYYAVPTRNTVLHRIILGPDGHMWFTELRTDMVGTLDAALGPVRRELRSDPGGSPCASKSAPCTSATSRPGGPPRSPITR